MTIEIFVLGILVLLVICGLSRYAIDTMTSATTSTTSTLSRCRHEYEIVGPHTLHLTDVNAPVTKKRKKKKRRQKPARPAAFSGHQNVPMQLD